MISLQIQNGVRYLSACLLSVGVGNEVVPTKDAVMVNGQTVPMTEDLAKALLSRDRQVADTAFADLTERLGLGRLKAVDRGAPRVYEREGRTSTRPYGDDPDSVVMREKIFRSVPNLPPQLYERLDPMITLCCRFFYRANTKLCLTLGYDLDDLKTYAQVWATNFWSVSRNITPASDDENMKLLYRALRQRFVEFRNQMRSLRSRNVLLDRQTISIATGVDWVFDADGYRNIEGRDEGNAKKAVEAVEVEPNTWHSRAVLRTRKPELDLSSETKRRESAKTMLAKLLGEMPHDRMVEVLTETSTSQFVCHDTQTEALRQLNLHQQKCADPKCHTAFLAPFSAAIAGANKKIRERAEKQLEIHRASCSSCSQAAK